MDTPVDLRSGGSATFTDRGYGFSIQALRVDRNDYHAAYAASLQDGWDAIIVANVDRKSALMTDDAGQYRPIGKEFASHETVNHGIEEYVRGNAHSNTVEGFFSILKRGINGVYHHVSEAHLSR